MKCYEPSRMNGHGILERKKEKKVTYDEIIVIATSFSLGTDDYLMEAPHWLVNPQHQPSPLIFTQQIRVF